MEENNRDYTNGEITVFWRPKECIHATTCFRELRSVFNPGKRPWVNMQGAGTEEIIRIVELCPTDALTYKWNKDLEEVEKTQKPVNQVFAKDEEMQSAIQAEIRVMPDGPLVVKGNFKIVGTGGNVLKTMKIASFCRCGQSMNMPFCDGMHRKIGFRSS